MLSEIDIIIRLLLAVILGVVVGFEREASDKPAGIRTHAIVGIGACLFTIIGLMISEQSATNLDATRIAAGIITGIGFLGAGALWRSEDRVKGLTTAAGIWAMGAIGIAAGLGYYFAAAFSTLLVYLVLDSGRIQAWLTEKSGKKRK